MLSFLSAELHQKPANYLSSCNIPGSDFHFHSLSPCFVHSSCAAGNGERIVEFEKKPSDLPSTLNLPNNASLLEPRLRRMLVFVHATTLQESWGVLACVSISGSVSEDFPLSACSCEPWHFDTRRCKATAVHTAYLVVELDCIVQQNLSPQLLAGSNKMTSWERQRLFKTLQSFALGQMSCLADSRSSMSSPRMIQPEIGFLWKGQDSNNSSLASFDPALLSPQLFRPLQNSVVECNLARLFLNMPTCATSEARSELFCKQKSGSWFQG